MATNINSYRYLWLALGVVLTAFVLLAVVLIGLGPNDVGASSHREAPLISKDPSADNVDTYVFIPEGVTDTIVLAATWIPFEAPEGGPNYFEWDDNVRYDIYIDNDGDARPEITYTLESKTASGDANSFLYNTGPITSLNSVNWKRPQHYTVTEVSESGGAVTLVGNVLAPPVNIGSKSTPNYEDLAEEATYTVNVGGDEINIFAGPRDDPFWVDLQVFDLLTLRGQDAPIGYSTGNNIPVDSLSGFNAHALVLEVPIGRLVDSDPTLGVWAGSRRQSTIVLNPGGLGGVAPSGPFVQVSRLGMPLVNEVVLPMPLKDVFNGIRPESDLGVYGLLQESVENPEVGTLLCALYGVPLPGDSNDDCNTEYTAGTPRTGRGDIFDIFVTGMVLANEFTIQTATGPFTLPVGFNVNQPAGVTPAEMIRINTNISGDLCDPDGPQRLGVLAGDACGFPNGRRLTDDIIEIELLAVAGAAYEVLDDRDASFSFNPAFIAALDDGLDGNDVSFVNEFPYLALPHSGQEHLHQNPRVPVYLPLILK